MQQNDHTDFIEFAKNLFVNPRTFFREYFNRYENVPFSRVAFIVFAISYGIDRINKSTTPGGFTDNWNMFWLIALIGGVVGGFIAYLIGGWFYNLRMKWSGGTSDLDTAKSLFLYSENISGAAIILSSLVAFVVKSHPSNYISFAYAVATILFLMFFRFYSVIVSFEGVVITTDVERGKAKIWFLFIPAGVYMVIYSFILWPVIESYLN